MGVAVTSVEGVQACCNCHGRGGRATVMTEELAGE